MKHAPRRSKAAAWTLSVALLLMLLSPVMLWCEQPLRITVREELSTRIGGRYVGHLFRETRAALREQDGKPVADIYRLVQSMKSWTGSAGQVEDSTTIGFDAGSPAGHAAARFPKVSKGAEDRWPFPYADFPSLPAPLPARGEGWDAPAVYYAQPIASAPAIPVQVLCSYQYVRTIQFQGESVNEISARFALRTPHRTANAGPATAELPAISGTHRLTILEATDGSGIRLIRDLVEEEYRYPPHTDLSAALPGGSENSPDQPNGRLLPGPPLSPDGGAGALHGAASQESPSTIRFNGFILVWFTPTSPLDRGRIAGTAQQELAPTGSDRVAQQTAGVSDVSVEQRPEGVRITLSNVHFLPDRADIVPEDASRLSRIADILTSVPDRTIRVVGFTADVGNPAGQKQLSLERARAVVEFLSRTGIPASRFIYEGRGAADPVADNSTESGRAQNRRVEITILED